MIARLRSWLAYRRFQSSFRKARADAQRRHAPTRDIDARQREIMNRALAGGAK